ncbi:MAG: acyl transferase domain-containing protein/7-keto-8-aminopelargonate synthetase-like enzyme [Bradymonadia bacterium]|jgi:acyl transferase domain-containing protein/7-keto-8-aminopelargonate synthetase-like enzyme/NAD(P)-dependent dehydrogenase (short-subunit alcohol dehydrogenase family)
MSSRSGARAGDVAIVGMGCRFAGAFDLHEYWKLTREGRAQFSPTPPDRWDADAFYSSNRRLADKSYAPTGAWIDDVRSFPALTLQIPPRRVEVMDPQQRLALETALQAVQDAGLTPEDLPRRTGVYVGVTATEYKTLSTARVTAQLMASGFFGDSGEDASVFSKAAERVVPTRPFSATGLLANMNAATIAQQFGLTGPAFTVDAACSSALVAICDAVTALRTGDIEVALAGGVYLCLTPEHHIAFSRIGAISAKGACRPFDAEADGFVQGDGGGMMLMKTLERAQADGDRIYAVIHGTALNNDGGSEGAMAPVKAGQVDVIGRAWADAGLSPNELGYVETHGTGTQVGDKTELEGLIEALGGDVKNAALGSSKANIGHTMSAAGVAGVTRACLALFHGERPPMAGFESPKPDLGIEDSPFYIPTQAEPWTGEGRLATVSAFGFGGTNAHIVLGAPPQPTHAASRAPAPITALEPAQNELLLLSAGTADDLRAEASRLAESLQGPRALTLPGAARALSVRHTLRYRAAIVAGDRQDAIAKLLALASGTSTDGVTTGEAVDAPKIAFLYPGQGAQRVGMLRGASERFDVVARTIEDLELALGNTLPLPLSHYLYPERRSESVSDEQANAELTATAQCQPALLATSFALTRLLEQCGVRPDVVAGHSVGEFSAAAVAGVVSAEDAVRWTAARGHAMANVSGDPGTMVAVVATREQVDALLVDGAEIANINHPQQLVVSGLTAAVSQVQANAEAAGYKAVRLNVSHGFHSAVFAGVDFAPLVEPIAFAEPTVTMASCIQTTPYASADDARRVFINHATSPVLFTETVRQCREAGVTLFLQVAAGGPLRSFVRGATAGEQVDILSLAGRDDDDGGASLLLGLGELFVRGVPVDPRAITAKSAPVGLPAQRLPRETYWVVKDAAQATLKIDATGQHAPLTAGEKATEDVSADDTPESDGIATAVLEAVARTSAYPVNSLRPSMTLMDDLGFDSMMMSDLTGELSKGIPGLPGIPRELLINGPTIADIIAFCENPVLATVDASDDDTPLHQYLPVLRPAALDASAPSFDWTGKTVVVLGSSVAVEQQLATAARESGANVLGSDTSERADAVVFACGTEMPPVNAVLANEAAAPALAARLIDVLDVQASLSNTPHVAVFAPECEPWAAGLAAVVKCVDRDDAGVRATSLAFASGAPLSEQWATLGREWGSEDTSLDVHYTGAGRHIIGFKRTEELSGSWQATASDVVAITGGTRGIGLLTAKAFAADGAKVVLVARSAPSDEVVAWVASTEGRVTALQVDVSDRAALSVALSGHSITCLVHSAGVLADGAFGSVSSEAGSLARAVKVGGLLNSISACGPSLKRALVVGSWAGRFGSRHQAHYAAANATAAAICGAANATVTLSCAEFGPWSQSEMASTIPESVQQSMRVEGVDFVGNEPGMAALRMSLGGAGGAVVWGRRVPSTTRRRSVPQTLTVETHPYLLDHAIEGRPVLPLAGATALMADAAGPSLPFELRDVTLFQGISVTEPVAIECIADGEKLSLKAGATLNYSATLSALSDDIEDGGALTGGALPDGLSLREFYDDVTFHGPLLQGIVSIDGIGDSFVYGTLRRGEPSDWIPGTTMSSWRVDPFVLDSAMQLSAYVAYTRFGRAGTPVSIARFVQIAPLTETLRAEVRFEPSEGDRFSADIDLRDETGRLLARATGVVAQLTKVEQADVADAPEVDDEAANFVVKPEWVDPSEFPGYKDLKMRQAMVDAMGLNNPYFDMHQGTARNTAQIDGREYINFSSYNYLGLSGDKRIIEDVHQAMHRYGTSVSASRIASGERPFHRELEQELAKAIGVEDAVAMPSGHATNVTTIGHLMGPNDLVLHDELIHDSCLQGIKLSGATRRGFRHEDPQHAEDLLKGLRHRFEKVLMVKEGVYSMDGDVSDIPAFIDVKKRYGCMLMVDEAHSFGTIGPNGFGIADLFDIDANDVDIWMGTMSKSLASMGGWIAGRASLVEFLKYTTPGFVFAAGMTPTIGQSALSALRLIREEPWRVEKLQHNAKFFWKALGDRGINTGVARGESPVIPAITGDSMHALLLAEALLKDGVNAKPIIFPAVGDDAARLRFFLSTLHTEEQLTRTADLIQTHLTRIRAEN